MIAGGNHTLIQCRPVRNDTVNLMTLRFFLLPFFNLPQSDDSLGCFPARAGIDSRVQSPTE